MWYVYFLGLKNKDIYVGSTNNLKRRLAEHKSLKCLSTKYLTPVKLLAYIVLPNESRARKLEKYFKTGSGKAILKKRILSDEAPLGA